MCFATTEKNIFVQQSDASELIDDVGVFLLQDKGGESSAPF